MDSSRSRFVERLGTALLLAAFVPWTNADAQEGNIPPSLKAREWDVPITIPAGGYRAARPIELSNEFEIRVGPGAYLEGVDFQSKDRPQRWSVDGSFLKKVLIGPPIGGRFAAKNSVFEDCLFYKKASGFDAFWSTRWTFENCVIARDFMHAPVNMADFSIVARSCTFLGVEFPDLGLKEKTDPASYMQSDNFVFDRCRFVRCKIPASVLAATRDCVFDQCTFPAMRNPWPVEMTEIKVRAYWDSPGTPSKPAVKKPLALEFEKLPFDSAPVGSTLNFSHSGGAVAWKDFPKPTRIETIGSKPATARELSAEQ